MDAGPRTTPLSPRPSPRPRPDPVEQPGEGEARERNHGQEVVGFEKTGLRHVGGRVGQGKGQHHRLHHPCQALLLGFLPDTSLAQPNSHQQAESGQRQNAEHDPQKAACRGEVGGSATAFPIDWPRYGPHSRFAEHG